MKTSEVLIKVQRHMGRGEYETWSHQRYICYAIDHLYYTVKVIGDRDRTRVQKIIMGHLDGAKSLEDWLYINHGIKFCLTPKYNAKVMATRLAWLAHLIEHYQSKGD